jgi:hypothetical protein
MILGLAMACWTIMYVLILYASGEIRKEVDYLWRRITKLFNF